MILLLFALLFLFIFLGMGIWAAMALSGLIYLLVTNLASLQVFVSSMVGGIDSTTLVSIPFFILAGTLMNRSGLTKRLSEFAGFFVGRFRGGLGYVSIVVSVIMSGVSGSAVADTSAVSSVLHPMMVERGYKPSFAAAINGSSSVIGPIIPPSVPMIFIGVLSGISIGRLFLGGIVPGLLMAVALWVMVIIHTHRNRYPTVEVEYTWARFWKLFKENILAILAPVFVIVGVVGGFVTLVEIAAFVVAYVIVISVFAYRSLRLRELFPIFREAAVFSASIMVLFAVVGLFQYIVAAEQAADQVYALVVSLNLEAWSFLLLSTLFFMLMGCVLDALPVMLIFFPVLLPVALELGIDPTHYGVIVVMNLMIGLLTPPIGALLFLQSKIADLEFDVIVKGVWPYTLALFLVLILVTYVPQLVLFVPEALL